MPSLQERYPQDCEDQMDENLVSIKEVVTEAGSQGKIRIANEQIISFETRNDALVE